MGNPRKEGAEARWRHEERSTNPYEDCSAFDDWDSGFDEADAHAAEDDRDDCDGSEEASRTQTNPESMTGAELLAAHFATRGDDTPRAEAVRAEIERREWEV